jgi:hypothetical protein
METNDETVPTGQDTTRDDEVREDERPLEYCSMPVQPTPDLPPGLTTDRLEAIVQARTKWANGTILHYYFFDRDTDGSQVRFSDGSTRFVSWVGPEAQRTVVREAFDAWKTTGLGLKFREVPDRSEAEIRIGFHPHDGSWSYVGRDVLAQGTNARTMNFGWDLTTPHGRSTALHEIGHTLGMPHEHQNPYAGIVWNEQAVYDHLGKPPNNWDRAKTYHNVLRKLDPAEVEGSNWDPDSIMHYAFPKGLITAPAPYANGIRPPGTLSTLDRQFVHHWYPGDTPEPATLRPFRSVKLDIKAGQQTDFVIEPTGTRRYRIGTFGASDTVIVLFEQVDGELRYVAGDDDSGQDRNALLRLQLFRGRNYVLRVRLYHSWESNETAVMYW